MGTPSSIAMYMKDGSLRSIYCHWDGYPEHVGNILKNHYTDPHKIAHLISLGDLSSLGEEIGKPHDFNARLDGVCTFYGRDRGEDKTEAMRHDSFSQWKQNRRNQVFHFYLFSSEDNCWYYSYGTSKINSPL